MIPESPGQKGTLTIRIDVAKRVLEFKVQRDDGGWTSFELTRDGAEQHHNLVGWCIDKLKELEKLSRES